MIQELNYFSSERTKSVSKCWVDFDPVKQIMVNQINKKQGLFVSQINKK